ncbi:MAG: ComEA family DNA-binding protein [Planctomycetota bacterium]|jgi:competence ComEA-like helix-hairpin-helix protein
MELDSINQAGGEQERIESLAFLIGAAVCVLVCGYFAVFEFVGSGDPDGLELEGKINPNSAAVGSLVRLPGIGMGRAGAIVAYRESAGGREGDSPVFQSCDDLQKVSGIGPRTVQNISGWLRFE